jgi:hypothetical protein
VIIKIVELTMAGELHFSKEKRHSLHHINPPWLHREDTRGPVGGETFAL